ncbi:MAG TPA: hypothetical protein VGH04_12345, partial [Gemmatimonadaceae bacterium]
VLNGGADALSRMRPTIMIEINPATLQPSGSSPARIVELLRGHGYRLVHAHRKRLEPLTTLPSTGQFINVFALPR